MTPQDYVLAASLGAGLLVGIFGLLYAKYG